MILDIHNLKVARLGVLFVLPMLAACPAGDDGDTGSNNTDPTAADDDGSGSGTVGDDDGQTSEPTAGDDDGGSADSTGTEPGSCPGGGGPGEDDAACTAHADCASGVCLLYTDVVDNQSGAVCGREPDNCGTRFTGTTFDFVTGAPVGAASIAVVAALDAALNPTGAAALVDGTSTSDGTVDLTSPEAIAAQLGVVGLSSGDGYYLTATGLAAPNDEGTYDVGSGVHDIWLVPTADLTAWSTALEDDADVDPAMDLPLGDAGGVVGLIRNGGTGVAVEGAAVVSTNDASTAVIRYLADDGSFTSDATGPSGIFVIINPMLAETFEATLDGATIGGPGTAGSANGTVFTLIMNTDA